MIEERIVKETNFKEPFKKDTSVDILKCLAALIITNSHMELLYGKYAFLATGGAIGDALFFFCSGYTLFLGRNRDFFNWYKRRIRRIYPTVFAWSVISALLWEVHYDMPNVLLKGGGWFVSCIMIYYVVLWFVRQVAPKYLKFVFVVMGTLILLWYVGIGIDDANGTNNMYGFCYFKWCHYFMFMLLGAVIGMRKNDVNRFQKVPHLWFTLIQLIACIAAFYSLYWFKKYDGVVWDLLQMSSLVPLACVCLLFYKLCNTELLARLYGHKYLGKIICFIGGLCLEIYLVQAPLFTDKLNFLFPVNLPIFLIVILFAAYLLRCLARIWGQIFSEKEFDWKEVIKGF